MLHLGLTYSNILVINNNHMSISYVVPVIDV